jgi:hypothetical protein
MVQVARLTAEREGLVSEPERIRGLPLLRHVLSEVKG